VSNQTSLEAFGSLRCAYKFARILLSLSTTLCGLPKGYLTTTAQQRLGDDSSTSSLFTTTMAALNQALFVLQIASPAVVLLSSLYVIPSRATLANQQSSSPITAVVIKSQSPRRALILSFLSLASLSFLADGLTFVVYAVLNKSWPVYSPIEISAVLGIIAYSGLAALGAYKDVKGLDVWSFKTVKAAITLALALDIATVVILGISFTKGTYPSCHHPIVCLSFCSLYSDRIAPRFLRFPCTCTGSSFPCTVQPACCIHACRVHQRGRRTSTH
jgi:hypothetical protein